jgi:hypothetical protein
MVFDSMDPTTMNILRQQRLSQQASQHATTEGMNAQASPSHAGLVPTAGGPQAYYYHLATTGATAGTTTAQQLYAAAAADEDALRLARIREYELLHLKERRLQEEIVMKRQLQRQQQAQAQAQQPFVMAIPLSEVEKQAFLDGMLQVPSNMVLRQTTEGTPVLVSAVQDPQQQALQQQQRHVQEQQALQQQQQQLLQSRYRGETTIITPSDLEYERFLLAQQRQQGTVYALPPPTQPYAVSEIQLRSSTMPPPAGAPPSSSSSSHIDLLQHHHHHHRSQQQRHGTLPTTITHESNSPSSPPVKTVSITSYNSIPGGGIDEQQQQQQHFQRQQLRQERGEETRKRKQMEEMYSNSIDRQPQQKQQQQTRPAKLQKISDQRYFRTKLENVKTFKISKKRPLSSTFRPNENAVVVFVNHPSSTAGRYGEVSPTLTGGEAGEASTATVEVSSNSTLKNIVRNYLKEYIRVPTHILQQHAHQTNPDSSDLATLVRNHKSSIIRRVIKTCNKLCHADPASGTLDESNNDVGFCCLEDSRWYELSDDAAARVVKEMFAVCRNEYIQHKLQRGYLKQKEQSDRDIQLHLERMEQERQQRGIRTQRIRELEQQQQQQQAQHLHREQQKQPATMELEKRDKKDEKKKKKKKKKTKQEHESSSSPVQQQQATTAITVAAAAVGAATKTKSSTVPAMRRKLPTLDNSDYYDSSSSENEEEVGSSPGSGPATTTHTGNGRSKGYKCGLCGQDKKGHVCPFKDDEFQGVKKPPRQKDDDEDNNSDEDEKERDDNKNKTNMNPEEGWAAYRGGIQVFKQDLFYTAARVNENMVDAPDDEEDEVKVKEPAEKKLLVETVDTYGAADANEVEPSSPVHDDGDDDSDSDDDLVF